MLKEVLEAETHHSLELTHNLLIELLALTIEPLCLNALGRILYPQILQPETDVRDYCIIFLFGFLVSKENCSILFEKIPKY